MQSESQHKHRCAVRQFLIYRKSWGLLKFQKYIREEKTIKLWLKVEKDFINQWKKGNRGEWGIWL
jgi:hypothetical protein